MDYEGFFKERGSVRSDQLPDRAAWYRTPAADPSPLHSDDGIDALGDVWSRLTLRRAA